MTVTKNIKKPFVQVILQISLWLCHSIHTCYGERRVCLDTITVWWLMSYAMALQRHRGKDQLSNSVI